MSRLTDERIAEILRPKDLMGETELESLAREVRELRAERDEANRTIDLQSRQISHQARQCQEIENERDEARKFNRRFRGLFAAAIFADSDPGKEWIRVCRDYDATQTQQPQPTQVELVPWTAETRPRGTVWTRYMGKDDRMWLVTFWGSLGWGDSGDYDISWSHGLEHFEWSRDGKTWNRCGTEVAK